MEILKLRQEVLNKIKKDPVLQGKLAKANDLQILSVYRWLAVNHKNLTTATNLGVIQAHYGYATTMELVEAEIQTAATTA